MPALMTKLFSAKNHNSLTQLTKRELEICELLIMGLDVKEVADKLNLSFKTVHVHRANAMSKLNVKNNVGLANLFNHNVNLF